MNSRAELSKVNLKNLRKIFPNEDYLVGKKKVFPLLAQGIYNKQLNDIDLEVIDVNHLKNHFHLDKFLLNYIRATRNQVITTVS